MKNLLAVGPTGLSGGLLCAILCISPAIGFAGGTIPFGPRVDRALTFEPGPLFLVHAPEERHSQIAVAANREPQLRIYSLKSDGSIAETRTIHTSLVVNKVIAGNNEDIVFFSRESGQIALFNGATLDERLLPGKFPKDADNLAVADIDNDGLSDFLFFGKGRSGLATYFGAGERRFNRGEILFPDFSISDLEVMDLNGDGIVDLFVSDWLSNQLLLYNGIGHGVFSEQVTLDLPGEPGNITLFKKESGKAVRLGVTFPELNEVRLYNVNSAGAFAPEAILRCQGSPKGIGFHDVNNDGRPDIVVPLENGMIVFAETTEGQLTDPLFFSIGGRMTDWRIGDVDGDSMPEALFVCSERPHLAILGNESSPGIGAWPAVFSVGLSPQGIVGGDFNGDHLTDVAVVNRGSSTISILIKDKQGRFRTQPSVRLSESESSVSIVSDPSRFAGTFVASQSTIKWVPKPGPTSSVLLTLSDTHIVFAEFPGGSDRLAFLVRSRDEQSGSLSLSLFDQIEDDQYTETSLYPTQSAFVTAIALQDIIGNKLRDLVFAAFDREEGRSSLFVAEAKNRFSFLPSTLVYSFPDSSGLIDLIIPSFIDRDARTDFVICMKPPENAIAILFGDSTTIVGDSIRWITPANPRDADACIVQDLNNDMQPDLCFVDGVSQNVVAYFGKGNGRFKQPKVICRAEDVGGMAVGLLNENKKYDLILSHSKEGTVSILFDPF